MIVPASKSSDRSQLSKAPTSGTYDVALVGTPADLLFTRTLPLKGLEDLVVVLVRCQAQPEIEACSRDDSHQCPNGRLPAARLIASDNGLGDAQPVRQLPLRQPRLQPSRKDEAAGDSGALERM